MTPLDQLNAPQSEFEIELDGIDLIVQSFKQLETFGSIKKAGRGTTDFSVVAKSLHSTLRDNRSRTTIMSGTVIMYLAGKFESYIRISIETLAECIADNTPNYDDLPKKMKDSIYSQTVAVASNPGKYGFEKIQAIEMLNNLAKNYDHDGSKININSKCLSVTDTNMNSDMVNELYRRAGTEGIWDEVGKSPELKVHFGSRNDREVRIESQKLLNDIMRVRNGVAHPNSNTNYPGPDKLGDYVAFMRILSRSITASSRALFASM